MVKLTGSPSVASPPTLPVTATVPPDSAALITSSAVIASTVMVASAASLSTMVPVPLVPPMVRVRVSLASMAASSVVGMVTLKLDVPAATVIVPSPLSVTPAPNVGAP